MRGVSTPCVTACSPSYSFFHSLFPSLFIFLFVFPCLCLLISPPLDDTVPAEREPGEVVDSLVRDIQNTQCLLNVEYAGATCPHVSLQFGDTKDDVGLGLVKEGMVMVDVRKEKHLAKMVRTRGARAGCGPPRGGSGSGGRARLLVQSRRRGVPERDASAYRRPTSRLPLP